MNSLCFHHNSGLCGLPMSGSYYGVCVCVSGMHVCVGVFVCEAESTWERNKKRKSIYINIYIQVIIFSGGLYYMCVCLNVSTHQIHFS